VNNNAIIENFDTVRNKYLKLDLSGVDSDTIVIYMRGSLDTSNSFFFKERLRMIIHAGYINLIFNMRELENILTNQIVIFTDLHRNLQIRTGDIVLVDLQSRVMKSFLGLGYDNYFKIVKDLGGAIDYLESDRTSILTEPITPLTICPICDNKLKPMQVGYKYHCPKCRSTLALDNRNKIFIE